MSFEPEKDEEEIFFPNFFLISAEHGGIVPSSFLFYYN
jgi:hypothetical protein